MEKSIYRDAYYEYLMSPFNIKFSQKNNSILDVLLKKIEKVAKDNGKKIKTAVNKDEKITAVNIFIDSGFRKTTVEKILSKAGFVKSNEAQYPDGKIVTLYYLDKKAHSYKAIVPHVNEVVKYFCIEATRKKVDEEDEEEDGEEDEEEE